MKAIRTINLTKKYLPPRGLSALMMKSPLKEVVTGVDNLSLEVEQGELFALVGPNGAGKTTLVKMLSTLVLPTSGQAWVNGHDLVREEGKVKGAIGFVASEERSFYWRLTGRQNLAFFAALHNFRPSEAKKRIDTIFERLGLLEAADNMFYTYSSGMKQKLAIARGLLTDPALLFLDEPTKSVDAVTARNLKNFIKQVLVEQEGRTVFFTTHRLEEVDELADRVAVMNRGRLIFCGTVGELKDQCRPLKQYLLQVQNISAEVLAEVSKRHGLVDFTLEPKVDSLVAVKFALANGDNPLSHVLGDIWRAGGNLISCQLQEVKLEEVFLDLVGDSVDTGGINGADDS